MTLDGKLCFFGISAVQKSASPNERTRRPTASTFMYKGSSILEAVGHATRDEVIIHVVYI